MARRDKSSRSKGHKSRSGSNRRQHRRTRSLDSYTSSSSCSCSDCGSSYDSDTSASSHRGRRGASRSKSKSSKSRSRSKRDREVIQQVVTVQEPPLLPKGSMGKQPKIAMILLLGREEREFRLTEAQILFDSPNDLTSTYYAQDPSDPDSSLAKTYRMPDRDAGVFEIIYRYMNRETVLPLRKSSCPKYLSYEQTERKLAEEAKFYRLTKLLKMLPKARDGHQQYGEVVDMHSMPGQTQNDVVARDYAQSYLQQQQHLISQQPQPYGSQQGSVNGAQPGAYAPSLPSYAPSPVPQQQQIQPVYATSQPASVQQLYSPAPQLPPTPMLQSSNPPQGISSPLMPPPPQSEASTSRSVRTSSSRRSHSRQSSSSRLTIKEEKRKAPEEVPNLTAFLYRGEAAPRRGEAPFPITGYPDDTPLPHLLIKATNAEIKFSAFRNAEDEDLFELRYSILILDEPATRPLAYRVRDATIKAVDSHLRLNGVLGTIEARDIPIRIHHSQQQNSSSSRSATSSQKDAESHHTSDLEELLTLLTTQGFVKWPRVWQDSFDNLTPPQSAHQRVSLPCAEILLALEFPEEAAQISAEVGGRGFILNHEDEDELQVRNYRVSLHAVKCETRKMRRLREMDELGQAVQDGMTLKTPTSTRQNALHSVRKASSDIGLSSPSRGRSDSGYGSERRASYDTASEVGSSVSRRAPRSETGGAATLAVPQHRQQPSGSPAVSESRYQYVKRPEHSSGQPSYSSQRSDVTTSTSHTAQGQQTQHYQYPQTPSTVSDLHLLQATQTQAIQSRPPAPRGHYHPLASNVPNTPQTWSKPQDPSYHQPTPLPTRPPPSPYYGSDPGLATPRAERRSETRLAVPGAGQSYGYTAGGRPRSGSSQSGISVRTTASEEIKQRAMERWG